MYLIGLYLNKNSIQIEYISEHMKARKEYFTLYRTSGDLAELPLQPNTYSLFITNIAVSSGCANNHTGTASGSARHTGLLVERWHSLHFRGPAARVTVCSSVFQLTCEKKMKGLLCYKAIIIYDVNCMLGVDSKALKMVKANTEWDDEACYGQHTSSMRTPQRPIW